MAEYKVGDIIKVRVSGIAKYGIFVHADSWYSGLIHISEISNCFIENIEHYVKMDEIVYCEVLDVDRTKLHLRLSIKNINYKAELDPNDIEESRTGFLPLKNKLPEWINEKIGEYNLKSE